MTGLLLTGMSVYERHQMRNEGLSRTPPPTAEGGLPFPSPNGTPTPKPSYQQ